MLHLPDPHTLQPRIHHFAGGDVACFDTNTTPLVKLDLRFEAGSAYQPTLLCSLAATHLFHLATRHHTSQQVADFMDSRGIVVEVEPDHFSNGISLYTHHRHLPQLLPLIDEWLHEPAFDPVDFEAFRQKQRLRIGTGMQKTDATARRMFYASLFGEQHPLGIHATPADADRLDREVVEAYFRERFRNPSVTVAGMVGDEGLHLLEPYLTQWHSQPPPAAAVLLQPVVSSPQTLEQVMDNASQTSLRMGRILPLRWNDPDYAQFMILCTALGGYFGSRLVQNIREEKGYTYGIYASTQIYRGCIVFYIVSDVAAGTAHDALHEVNAELLRLAQEPMSDDELELLRTVLASDFLRSVDGVFELSARYIDMEATQVDETLTANLSHALQHTTPAQLQALAGRLLNPADMTVCLAGTL